MIVSGLNYFIEELYRVEERSKYTSTYNSEAVARKCSVK